MAGGLKTRAYRAEGKESQLGDCLALQAKA
jgi:hypothetical protein